MQKWYAGSGATLYDAENLLGHAAVHRITPYQELYTGMYLGVKR